MSLALIVCKIWRLTLHAICPAGRASWPCVERTDFMRMGSPGVCQQQVIAALIMSICR